MDDHDPAEDPLADYEPYVFDCRTDEYDEDEKEMIDVLFRTLDMIRTHNLEALVVIGLTTDKGSIRPTVIKNGVDTFRLYGALNYAALNLGIGMHSYERHVEEQSKQSRIEEEEKKPTIQ